MAFTQFPNIGYFRPLDTDTITQMGYFNIDAGTELKHMMLTVYMNAPVSSPFTSRINVYGTAALDTPIFRSDWVTISSATLVPSYTTGWLGNIYYDFSGNPLNPNIDYYMGIETSGYTRIADSYYFSFNLDWYSPVNNAVDSSQAGARIRILGNR